MKYRRFEDFPAWQGAIELGVRVFALTATASFQGYSGLRDQLERAAVSVSNNIAEGAERGTRDELLTFLYYSKGSMGEVRSMLHLLRRLPRLSDQAEELEELRAMSENLCRQLGAWIESLKNSDDKGPRHHTQRTREAIESAHKQEMFLDHLRRIVDAGRTGEPDFPKDAP